jgi:cytochrome c
MANELRIAAMTFVLSTSSALAQDMAAGETTFRRCQPCHAIGAGASNKIGPQLNGIEGRKCGTASGYSYSEANRNSAFSWNEVIFLDYIKDPKAKIPGTKKSFTGIKESRDALNLWAYLRQFGPDGKLK